MCVFGHYRHILKKILKLKPAQKINLGMYSHIYHGHPSQLVKKQTGICSFCSMELVSGNSLMKTLKTGSREQKACSCCKLWDWFTLHHCFTVNSTKSRYGTLENTWQVWAGTEILKIIHFNKFEFLGREQRQKAVSWSVLTIIVTVSKVCCIWAVSCPKPQPDLEVTYKDRLLLTYLVLRRYGRELEDLTRCLGKV